MGNKRGNAGKNRGQPTDMDSLDRTVRSLNPGRTLFRRYTLKKVLGRGGMGIVWLARDEELDRDVALKFLPDLIVSDPSLLSDLKRETRRSLELTHPNIVRIHDFVQDGTYACISMEYVDGSTLSASRAEKPNRVFEAPDLEEWLKQWSFAMDYAHGHARVVHCDLKPANLMLNSRGILKVTDFGISRSLSESATRLTVRRTQSGTLAYMSPQQLEGERPSHLDDIYAMGATIFELLTSKPPFYRGQIDQQILAKHPPRLSDRRRELEIKSPFIIPEAWEEAIATSLAKNPAERPQSAEQLLNALGLTNGSRAKHVEYSRSVAKDTRTVEPVRSATADTERVNRLIPSPDIRKAAPRAGAFRKGYAWLSARSRLGIGAMVILFLALVLAGWIFLYRIGHEDRISAARADGVQSASPESKSVVDRKPIAAPESPRESTPMAGPTASPSEEPVAVGARIYTQADVDRLIKHVKSLGERGIMDDTLTRLKKIAGKDSEDLSMIATMALINDAMQQGNEAEELWGIILQTGPQIGALYGLARERLGEGTEAIPLLETPSPAPLAQASPFPQDGGLDSSASEMTSDRQRVDAFLRRFVTLGQSDNTKAILSCYAPRVRYFDNGSVDHSFIQNEHTKYLSRWPVRREQILGNITVTDLTRGQRTAAFRSNYRLENPVRKDWAEGEVDQWFKVETLSGALVITEVRAAAVSRKTGSLQATRREGGDAQQDRSSAASGDVAAQPPSPSPVPTPNVSHAAFPGKWAGTMREELNGRTTADKANIVVEIDAALSRIDMVIGRTRARYKLLKDPGGSLGWNHIITGFRKHFSRQARSP